MWASFLKDFMLGNFSEHHTNAAKVVVEAICNVCIRFCLDLSISLAMLQDVLFLFGFSIGQRMTHIGGNSICFVIYVMLATIQRNIVVWHHVCILH